MKMWLKSKKRGVEKNQLKKKIELENSGAIRNSIKKLRKSWRSVVQAQKWAVIWIEKEGEM